MLESAPAPKDILPGFLSFVGNSVLIGHNVHFDINFLYDAILSNLGIHFSNDFIDSMRIARKIFPELKHHRLSDIAKLYDILPEKSHRSFDDCITTASCFQRMKQDILQDILSTMTEDEFKAKFKQKSYSSFIKDLNISVIDMDESSPIFKKTVVFTGSLDKMSRKDAMKLVVSHGGIPSNSISKSTNYLVVRNQEFPSSVKGGKTSKIKRAEILALKGFDIHVISEDTFFLCSIHNSC